MKKTYKRMEGGESYSEAHVPRDGNYYSGSGYTERVSSVRTTSARRDRVRDDARPDSTARAVGHTVGYIVESPISAS